LNAFFQIAVVFDPGYGDEEEDKDDDHTLFRLRQNKQLQQPFHLVA
jgi:hypothetical protein